MLFNVWQRYLAMQDLPIPETMTKLSSSEPLVGLPIPQILMGKSINGENETLIPIPLDQIDRVVKISSPTTQTLPLPLSQTLMGKSINGENESPVPIPLDQINRVVKTSLTIPQTLPLPQSIE